MSEPRPLQLGVSGTNKGVQYHEFECVECGATDRNTYCEPHRTHMLTRRLCFMCNFWFDFEKDSYPARNSLTIINGHTYSPGNRTSGSFRGMGGRRFDIEYIGTSVYAGQKCTTFDLWSGSTLPERLREKFPDTARFLNGAERFEPAGDTPGCWNGSDRKAPPYPSPSLLVRKATTETERKT